MDYMAKHSISIAAVQETPSGPTPPEGSIWVLYHLHRQAIERGKGGGLAFIIHQDVHHRVHNLISIDLHLEQQAIKVRKGCSDITIVNIYCPSASSCSSGYELNSSHLLHLDNTIIVGDFIAHHYLWHSALTGDTRRNQVAQEVENSGFVILNEDAPTRVTSRVTSSPDITLVTEGLYRETIWTTAAALGSDHLPILVSFQCEFVKSTSDNRTFTNFRKTNWEGFDFNTEDAFATMSLPRDMRSASVFSDASWSRRLPRTFWQVSPCCGEVWRQAPGPC